ncbi:hypothetical protein ACFLX3_00825 [Chloroflexota bacterium]
MTKLEQAQVKITELTSILEDSKAELEGAKTEFASFKAEGQRLYELMAGNLVLNEAILEVNGALLLKDSSALSKAAVTISNVLAGLRDLKAAELKALWDEAYKVEGGRPNLYCKLFNKFMQMNMARIKVKVKALREHLNKYQGGVK